MYSTIVQVLSILWPSIILAGHWHSVLLHDDDGHAFD